MEKKHAYKFGLAFILLFHLVFNAIWLSLDKSPLPFDPANHSIASIEIKDCLLNFSKHGFVQCLYISSFYPPFTETIVALFLIIFGTNWLVLSYINTVIFVFLLVGVYLWAKDFYKDEKIALSTVAITSLIPELYNLSKYLWQEVMLIALTYFVMYFLLKSEALAKEKYARLAFLFIGLGILTKIFVLVYVAVPLLFVFIESLKDRGIKSTARDALSGAIITLLVPLPWLLANAKDFLYFTSFFSGPEPLEPTTVLSLKNLIFYPEWLIKFGLGFILTLLVVGSFVVFLKHAEKAKKAYLLSLVVIVYVIFTISGNKDARYAFFLLPIAASLISFAVVQTFSKSAKAMTLVFAGILLALAFQYFEFSFNFPINTNYKYAIKFPVLGHVDIVNVAQNFPALPYYDSFEWPNEKVIEDVHKLSGGKRVLLQAIVEYPRLNNRNLVLAAKLKRYDNVIINDDLPFGHKDGFKSSEEVVAYIKTKDFILVPEHEWTTGHYLFKTALDPIQREIFKPDITYLKLIKTYALPYEEMEKLLRETKRPDDAGVRYKACENVKCDKLILFEVVN